MTAAESATGGASPAAAVSGSVNPTEAAPADVEPTAATAHAATPADTAIRAATTAVRGRYVFSARANHFVSDARVGVGPGEAVNAGELLLSALVSCALAIVQNTAAERGLPLKRVHADAAFERHADDHTRYERIDLAFTLTGVALAEAEELVAAFAAGCPIYNTVKRGGGNPVLHVAVD